ncbi:unnamed protein product [Closterium sp. NIES-53]
MLLVSATGDVLGRAKYTGRVLYTDLRLCTATLMMTTAETLALRTITMAAKSTPARWHVRLAHVDVDTIKSSAKHEVATGPDIKQSAGADLPWVSCVSGKLARHTFPNKVFDADDALAVLHIDLCRPFRVDAKDGSLYFLLLKDRKIRYECADDAAAHGRAAPLVTPRPVADRHGAQLPLGTTPSQLLTSKKPDLMLARAWSCMAQFLVPEQQHGGKLKAKARWGLHLGVSEERKGWEILDLTDNRVVTTSDVVFYETLSLKVWKSEHGPASRRTQVTLPTYTSTATLPLLAVVGELADEDAEDVRPPSLSPALPAPPFVADLLELKPTSDSGDKGSNGASPVVPAKSIEGSQHDAKQVSVRQKSTPIVRGGAAEFCGAGTSLIGEQQVAKLTKESATGQSAGTPTLVQQNIEGSEAGDGEKEQTVAGQSTDSDVVEVQVDQPGLERQIWDPPERLTYHVCLPPGAFTTVYDDADDAMPYNDVACRLGAGLCRRPARRQQQHCDAKGAEGAAGGRL